MKLGGEKLWKGNGFWMLYGLGVECLTCAYVVWITVFVCVCVVFDCMVVYRVVKAWLWLGVLRFVYIMFRTDFADI